MFCIPWPIMKNHETECLGCFSMILNGFATQQPWDPQMDRHAPDNPCWSQMLPGAPRSSKMLPDTTPNPSHYHQHQPQHQYHPKPMSKALPASRRYRNKSMRICQRFATAGQNDQSPSTGQVGGVTLSRYVLLSLFELFYWTFCAKLNGAPMRLQWWEMEKVGYSILSFRGIL